MSRLPSQPGGAATRRRHPPRRRPRAARPRLRRGLEDRGPERVDHRPLDRRTQGRLGNREFTRPFRGRGRAALRRLRPVRLLDRRRRPAARRGPSGRKPLGRGVDRPQLPRRRVHRHHRGQRRPRRRAGRPPRHRPRRGIAVHGQHLRRQRAAGAAARDHLPRVLAGARHRRDAGQPDHPERRRQHARHHGALHRHGDEPRTAPLGGQERIRLRLLRSRARQYQRPVLRGGGRKDQLLGAGIARVLLADPELRARVDRAVPADPHSGRAVGHVPLRHRRRHRRRRKPAGRARGGGEHRRLAALGHGGRCGRQSRRRCARACDRYYGPFCRELRADRGRRKLVGTGAARQLFGARGGRRSDRERGAGHHRAVDGAARRQSDGGRAIGDQRDRDRQGRPPDPRQDRPRTGEHSAADAPGRDGRDVGQAAHRRLQRRRQGHRAGLPRNLARDVLARLRIRPAGRRRRRATGRQRERQRDVAPRNRYQRLDLGRLPRPRAVLARRRRPPAIESARVRRRGRGSADLDRARVHRRLRPRCGRSRADAVHAYHRRDGADDERKRSLQHLPADADRDRAQCRRIQLVQQDDSRRDRRGAHSADRDRRGADRADEPSAHGRDGVPRLDSFRPEQFHRAGQRVRFHDHLGRDGGVERRSSRQLRRLSGRHELHRSLTPNGVRLVLLSRSREVRDRHRQFRLAQRQPARGRISAELLANRHG